MELLAEISEHFECLNQGALNLIVSLGSQIFNALYGSSDLVGRQCF